MVTHIGATAATVGQQDRLLLGLRLLQQLQRVHLFGLHIYGGKLLGLPQGPELLIRLSRLLLEVATVVLLSC